jgi:amino acid adenylation domain-containing protein
MSSLTIDSLLLRHATATPDALAIATPTRQYRWRDLSQAVSAYAATLAGAGLRKGDRLLAIMDPGFEAVAVLCAAARRGLIWVPTSPENPASRIQAVIDTAQPAAIVMGPAQERPPGITLSADVAVGVAREDALSWTEPPPSRRTIAPSEEVLAIDPAYIIFTSGSTGRPKGIVLTHAAACAFFEALIAFNQLPPGSVVGSIAPIQFDFWLLDLGAGLGAGGSMAFIPRPSFFQPRRMAQHMRALGVRQMNGVPSIWTSLLRHAPADLGAIDTLEAILFAGEPFPLRDLRQLQNLFPRLRVINCFGQSESIACSFADVPNPLPADAERITFGRGHLGVELLHLDEDGRRISEPNRTGELYLRAPNLFLGYWGDPDGTARALVPHPLQPYTGERVFKTGDLVQADDAGRFYFVGRKDEQVKINGNRVELGDIAASVRQMPGVTDAVVLAEHEADAPCALLLFVVPAPAATLTAEAVRAFCLQTLPRHMLPGEITIRAGFPLTGNGKIDTQRLRQERRFSEAR